MACMKMVVCKLSVKAVMFLITKIVFIISLKIIRKLGHECH